LLEPNGKLAEERGSDVPFRWLETDRISLAQVGILCFRGVLVSLSSPARRSSRGSAQLGLTGRDLQTRAGRRAALR
jgi:hypothetical protein